MKIRMKSSFDDWSEPTLFKEVEAWCIQAFPSIPTMAPNTSSPCIPRKELADSFRTHWPYFNAGAILLVFLAWRQPFLISTIVLMEKRQELWCWKKKAVTEYRRGGIHLWLSGDRVVQNHASKNAASPRNKSIGWTLWENRMEKADQGIIVILCRHSWLFFTHWCSQNTLPLQWFEPALETHLRCFGQARSSALGGIFKRWRLI